MVHDIDLVMWSHLATEGEEVTTPAGLQPLTQRKQKQIPVGVQQFLQGLPLTLCPLHSNASRYPAGGIIF
jgi:hypothetical protein